MTKRPEGVCHICGKFGKLSFEHSPPEAAFNNRPLVYAAIKKLIGTSNLDNPKGRTQQRGAGAYTLCERCNNLSGHWYGGAFVEMAYQGMQILQRAGKAPTLYENNFWFHDQYHKLKLAAADLLKTAHSSEGRRRRRSRHSDPASTRF